MPTKKPYGLLRFPAKLTPAEERPYSAESLLSICENYAPFILHAVHQLELSQRRFDESEGEDAKAAADISEQSFRIWQAIEYGTNRAGATGRTSTETDVWYDAPVARPVNPEAAEIRPHERLPED